MKNLNRKCCLCGYQTCESDKIVCNECKRYKSTWTWKIPSSMDYIEHKFIENIASLSAERKEELINLLSKK